MTVIWGLYDTVSPPRVASYVWNQYLMLKPGGNRLYFIPDANHYLQVNRPEAFVKVLLHTLEPADDQGPGALEAELDAPLLVNSSSMNGCGRSRRAPRRTLRRPELRTVACTMQPSSPPSRRRRGRRWRGRGNR